MLAQSREVLVQLLDTLLVSLDTLALETVVELYHAVSTCPTLANSGR